MKTEKVTRNVKEKVYILFYQAFPLLLDRIFKVHHHCIDLA